MSRTRSLFFPTCLSRIFRTCIHAPIDSSLTVASASTRRARIENWESARERGEKRRGKRNARHLREVIFAEQEKKDSCKLGGPRGPCECQQPFATCIRFCSASTTLLRSRKAVRGRRNRRRLRHVENATSAEWLGGDYNWEVVAFLFFFRE